MGDLGGQNYETKTHYPATRDDIGQYLWHHCDSSKIKVNHTTIYGNTLEEGRRTG